MAEPQGEPQSPEEKPKSSTGREKFETWGYDMYPERRKTDADFTIKDFFSWKSRNNIEQYKCEKTVVDVIKTSPLVRVMVSALKKAGCPVNFRRHIQCEHCEPIVTGGYDPVFNQIVICNNTSRSKGFVENVLVHELIHMFDYCTREMDFKNIDHLACSEIRAANMTYCSYPSAFWGEHIDRTKVRNQQQECVKRRASDSVYAVRNITREEADAAVEKVFHKCYNDTEPLGRRIRRSLNGSDLIYSEAYLLGYD